MTKYNREPLRPTANIGDIITIKGYGIRTFKVDSLTHERYIDEENDVDEIYYDCTCVKTFEPMLANQEDVAVVSSAEDARVLRNYLREGGALIQPTTNGGQQSVDDLLDELSDALALEELFGEPNNPDGDLTYAIRVDEIKTQLKDRTEGGVW